MIFVLNCLYFVIDNKRAVELPKAYPVMYQYPVQHSFYSPYFGGVYQQATENYLPYQHRGRGGFNAPGPSRGMFNDINFS